LKAGVTDRRGHQLTHGLPSSLAQPAQQLTVVEEERAKHLRDREGPQTVSDLLEHLVGEKGAEHRPALGGARGAEAAPLTGERHQKLGAALVAAHPGEAVIEDPAVA